MKVKIGWRTVLKHPSYANIWDCPLVVTLQKLGLDVETVGGHDFMLKRKDGTVARYSFESTPEAGVGTYYAKPKHRAPKRSWNCDTLEWCKRRHRSFELEIPGLEAEFTAEQLAKLGFWKHGAGEDVR